MTAFSSIHFVNIGDNDAITASARRDGAFTFFTVQNGATHVVISDTHDKVVAAIESWLDTVNAL